MIIGAIWLIRCPPSRRSSAAHNKGLDVSKEHAKKSAALHANEEEKQRREYEKERLQVEADIEQNIEAYRRLPRETPKGCLAALFTHPIQPARRGRIIQDMGAAIQLEGSRFLQIPHTTDLEMKLRAQAIPSPKPAVSARIIGVCRLCKLNMPLCMSHIVPNFFWVDSGLKVCGGSFEVVCLSHPEHSNPHCQDGFKELLLCDACENKLGRYESYAKKILFGHQGLLTNRPSSPYLWKGLDYKSMKLFQISILWRMGVSSHAYYSHVNLGLHEEKMRSMLLSDDAGEPWEYGCIASLLNRKGIPLKSLFAQPHELLHMEYKCYRFVLAGMQWEMLLSSVKPNDMVCCRVLSREGNWSIANCDIRFIPYLALLWQELLARWGKAYSP